MQNLTYFLEKETWAPLSIDTRTLNQGDIFLALRGKRCDGHTFVDEATKKGARARIVQEKIEHPSSAISVPDTQEALEYIAKFRRAQTKATIVGITGSVGKTTLKEMLAHLCAAFGETVYSRLSYNNHVGVPLSVAQIKPHTHYGVFEMGTNHVGEIEPLSHIVQPHIAVITAIEEAHMAHFPSFEALADEKASILSGLRAGGSLVVPQNLKKGRILESFLAQNSAIFIGQHVKLLHYQLAWNKTNVEASIFGHRFDYTLSSPGYHIIINSLYALACAHLLSLPLNETLKQALFEFRVPEGRGSFIPLQRDGLNFTLIDGSYNANPASMRSALELLALAPKQAKRIAILGDMLELGLDREKQAHEQLLEPLLKAKVDCVIAIGPLMKHLFHRLPQTMRGFWVENTNQLEPELWNYICDKCFVLFKSSYSMGLNTFVKSLFQ